MTGPSSAKSWADLAEGMTAAVPFSVSQADMDTFRDLTGDHSLAHTDANFARARGFAGPVVYGALMVARLSQLLGEHLPGAYGLSNSWEIHFHNPLYVGDDAILEGEISRLSAATHTITVKFRVSVGDRLIAKGTAHSSVLEPAEAS